MARKPTDTATLSLRIREELRRQLEREAKRQERSLNAEIIYRLEQSFRKSEEAELTADAFRAALGDKTGDLVRTITTAIWLIEKGAGKKWHEDPDTGWQLRHALDLIVQAFSPAGPPNAERIVGQMERARYFDEGFAKRRRKEDKPERHPVIESGLSAALQALQKMGMAPSDAEIEEVAKKRAQAAEIPLTSDPQPSVSSIPQPSKPKDESK